MSRAALLSFFFCLVFASLFFAEVTGLLRQSFDSIAYLTESNGTILRLPSGQYSWDRIGNGSPLADEDTLATGDDAKAIIKFPAWGELQIESNSMIVISKTPTGEAKLDFVMGAGTLFVKENAKDKVSIKKSNQKVRVVEKARPRENDSYAPLPFRVSQSDFLFGKSPLKGHINFSQLSFAPVPPAPTSLLTPETLMGPPLIDFNRVTQLKLGWKLRGKDQAGFEVVFFPSKKGEKPLTFKSPVSSLVLKELPSGTYLWSVKSIFKDGKRSPASKSKRIVVRARENLKKPVLLPEIWRDKD